MITNALDRKPLQQVEDNCRGILAVLEKGRPGEVYNIGGPDIEKNLTVARRILELTDRPESLPSYAKDRSGHRRKDCVRRSIGTARERGAPISMEIVSASSSILDW